MLDVIASTQAAPVSAMLAQKIASKGDAIRADFDGLLAEQKDHADVRLARAALALLRAFPDDAAAAARAHAALARYRADSPLSIKERFYVKKLYYLAAACYARHSDAMLGDAARYLTEILSRDPSDEDADALWSAMAREGLARQ